MSTVFDIVPASHSRLGGSDHTRRWALQAPGGPPRFAGVTRPEADGARGWLGALDDHDMDDVLVPVQLEVVMSDGAGPYMLDAAGNLILRVGDHPIIPGCSIAMGEVDTAMVRLGAVVDRRPEGFVWIASRTVSHASRVGELDRLAACSGSGDLHSWRDDNLVTGARSMR